MEEVGIIQTDNIKNLNLNITSNPLGFIQRKLNETPKETYPNITNSRGYIGQKAKCDLEEAESSTILRNSWASSSVRIEHQPPKLGVEGSNPSPPARVLFLQIKLTPMRITAF